MYSIWTVLPVNDGGSYVSSIIATAFLFLVAGIATFVSLRWTMCYLIALAGSLVALDLTFFALAAIESYRVDHGYGAAIANGFLGLCAFFCGFAGMLTVAVLRLPKVVFPNIGEKTRIAIATAATAFFFAVIVLVGYASSTF